MGTPPESAHTRGQNQALVRQTLDDAVATVLDAAVDPATKRWRTTLPLGAAFTVEGYRVDVEDYHLEEGSTVAAFRLVAYRGGVGQRIESRYRIPNAGWPGPLWIDAPYAVSNVDTKATINGGGRDVLLRRDALHELPSRDRPQPRRPRDGPRRAARDRPRHARAR